MIKARWPEVGVVDSTLLKEAVYLNDTLHDLRVRIKRMMEIREKVGLYKAHQI